MRLARPLPSGVNSALFCFWLEAGLGRGLGRAEVHLARPLSSGVKFYDFDEFDQVWSRCVWLEPASAKLTDASAKIGGDHELDIIKF